MLSNASALFSLLIVSVSCSNTFAESLQKSIPDTIDLKMGAKTLKFEHGKHIKSLDSVCVYCHLKINGKIDGGLGKDTARIICISCHDKNPDFKPDCKGCHSTEKAMTSK
jgi:hypothetical protein